MKKYFSKSINQLKELEHEILNWLGNATGYNPANVLTEIEIENNIVGVLISVEEMDPGEGGKYLRPHFRLFDESKERQPEQITAALNTEFPHICEISFAKSEICTLFFIVETLDPQ